MLKKKKKFPLHIFLSNFNSFLSLPSLICFSISVLSSLRTQTPSLLSLPSLLGPVFGLWVLCLGRGSYVWVVGDGVGQWWLWLWVTPSLHHSRNGHTSFYESNHREDHLVRFPIVKPLTLCCVSNAHMWGDVVFRPKIPHPLLGVY